MKLLSLSWILISLSLVYASSIYEPANPWLSLTFILAALLSSFLAFYGSSKARPGEARTRRPASGAATGPVPALKQALFYSLFILLPQLALLPFYAIFASRHHAESLLTPLVSFLMNLFGLPAVAEGPLIYMDAALKSYSFLSTWEKFGLLYLLMILIGLGVSLGLRRELKRAPALLALILVYFILRYTFMIMLYSTYFMHSLFWERSIMIASLIPLCLLLMYLDRGMPAMSLNTNISLDRTTGITALLCTALIFTGSLIFSNMDLGIEKEGRVVIDEYHSDWEWTTEVYDENWYGERSGYNYYCFYNYIDKYYTTSINQKPITKGLLDDCDVLILKTPTKPYTDEEVEVICHYVEEGGGLYLIGDHTNVFGTGSNLNQVAERFGLSFNYDCTYELVGGNLSTYKRPLLLAHKALGTMENFLFATSCTLSAPWYAEDVIVGYGLKNLQADYSQKNFFPADQNSPRLEFGLFLQSAALKHKEGRVLAYTDSTVFSNFWMFMRGKPELLLGNLSWLNRRNAMPGLSTRLVYTVLSLVLLIVNLIWWMRRPRSINTLILIPAAILGFILALATVFVVNALTTRSQEPIKDMVDIGFERAYSDYKLPDDLAGFKSNTDELLTTFYVWTQRLGYFPKSHDTIMDALRSADLSVLVRPKSDIKEVDEILREVEKGAKLLIMDSSKYGAHSNRLLESIDMRLIEAEMANFSSYDELKHIALSDKASAIRGGESLIRDARGNTIFAVKPVGRGLIAVFSDPDSFYNHKLGDVSMNLTANTEVLSKLEFKIMKYLIGLTP